MEESCGEFGSWEEASQVGNKALKFAGELIPPRSSVTEPRRGNTLPRRRSEEARSGLAGIPVESVVALTVLLNYPVLLIVEWPKIKSTYIPLTSA